MADTFALELDIEPKFPSAAIQQMIDVAGEAFGKALASPKVKAPMDDLANTFQKAFAAGKGVLSGVGGKIGTGVASAGAAAGLGGVAKGAGAIGGVLSGVMGAVMGVLGPIGVIVGVIAAVVQGVNPAIVEQLMLAFSEIWGVIGQAFTPVLVAIIPILQAWGDVVASLMPILKPVIWLLTTLAQAIAWVVKGFAQLISLIPGLGGTSRGSTTSGSGMVGLGELSKQILVGGMNVAGPDWKKAIVETAEYTRRTSENTGRKEEPRPGFSGGG